MTTKLRIKNLISFSLFSSSLFLTYVFGELFYNSIDGTDFYRYFQYIEYFNGTKNSPTREQGLLYFWYISNFIEMSQNYYLPDKWEFIYSSAIQLGNFILYVIGLIGFYFWLVGKNISKNLIFLSFTVLTIGCSASIISEDFIPCSVSRSRRVIEIGPAEEKIPVASLILPLISFGSFS